MTTAPKDVFTISVRIRVTLASAALTLMAAFPIHAQTSYDYRVLATSKTSTLEKEMNEAADAGFRFSFVMGGETAVGGSEGVAVLTKTGQAGRYSYKLLATTKTSTLEKELRGAGTAGYEVIGMTVSKTALGGKELVAITRKAK